MIKKVPKTCKSLANLRDESTVRGTTLLAEKIGRSPDSIKSAATVTGQTGIPYTAAPFRDSAQE